MSGFADAVDSITEESAEDKFIEGRVTGLPALEDMQSRVPELADSIGLTGTGTPTVEPTENLTDDEFEAFTQARQESPFLTFNKYEKRNEVRESEVPDEDQPPDPREVHESRSEYAQEQDENRDARVTTNPRKYANDPDSWDFPGVDTGPEFERVYGSSLSASRLNTVEDAARGDGPDALSDLFPRI